jgi:AhpD family alkylhydroperoxidase
MSTERNPERPPRLNVSGLAPGIYKALIRLETEISKEIDPVIGELVKIRASQINHCAFCLDMHTKDALAAGETVERIVQLSAWEESQHFYSPKEVAALELTEAITLLTDGFVPDEVFERVRKHFDDAELAGLIAAITMINTWNRLSVSVRNPPGHYTPAAGAGKA